jgi:dihydrolipoamide dehydrogenase
MPKKYDVAIIGSGPGGYAAAIRLCQLGKSVCVIDVSEERLGGVCLNEGCIPVKSLINSSKIFAAIKNSKNYGLEAEVKPPDMEKIVACSQDAASRLRNGLKSLFKKNGIEFIIGRAKLTSANKLNVKLKDGKQQELEANKIIIAAGSSSKNLLGIEIDGETAMTSSEAVKLRKVPETLLVIGAGTIGVEFCSMFASFGAKVALVEMMPNILPSGDEEISKALARIFKKKGVEIFVNTKVKSINKRGNSVEAVLDAGGSEKKLGFESVLLAMGRIPNVEGIGLGKAGVKLQDGFIATDDKMRTNIKGVYAVGDVLNTPMYAHAAYKEGLTAAEDIAGIKTEPINYENVPSIVFSEPQVASVGLTESEAKESGYEVVISRHFFKANGLAVATRREDGFIKIIADKKRQKILGVHIIGGDATEILHEFVVAKNSNLPIGDIAKAVHAHPTFSEIAVDAAKALFGTPIHG